MSIQVEIEGKGQVAEFPDGTPPEIIDAAIKRDYFAKAEQKPIPLKAPNNIDMMDLMSQGQEPLGSIPGVPGNVTDIKNEPMAAPVDPRNNPDAYRALVGAAGGVVGLMAGGLVKAGAILPHAPGFTPAGETTIQERMAEAIPVADTLAQKFIIPQTKQSVPAMEALGKPFEALSNTAKSAGQGTLERTGSPLLATLAETAIESIPFILPYTFKGSRFAAAKIAKSEWWRDLTTDRKVAILDTINRNADDASLGASIRRAKQSGDYARFEEEVLARGTGEDLPPRPAPVSQEPVAQKPIVTEPPRPPDPPAKAKLKADIRTILDEVIKEKPPVAEAPVKPSEPPLAAPEMIATAPSTVPPVEGGIEVKGPEVKAPTPEIITDPAHVNIVDDIIKSIELNEGAGSSREYQVHTYGEIGGQVWSVYLDAIHNKGMTKAQAKQHAIDFLSDTLPPPADLPGAETVTPPSPVAQAAPTEGVPIDIEKAKKILYPDSDSLGAGDYFRDIMTPLLKRLNSYRLSGETILGTTRDAGTLRHIDKLVDAGLIERKWNKNGDTYYQKPGTPSSDLLNIEEVRALEASQAAPLVAEKAITEEAQAPVLRDESLNEGAQPAPVKEPAEKVNANKLLNFNNLDEYTDYYKSNIKGEHIDVVGDKLSFKDSNLIHLIKLTENGSFDKTRAKQLSLILDLIKDPDKIRGAEYFSKSYSDGRIYLKSFFLPKENKKLLLAVAFDGDSYSPITSFDNPSKTQLANIEKGKDIYTKNAGLTSPSDSGSPARVTEDSMTGNLPQQEVRNGETSKTDTDIIGTTAKEVKPKPAPLKLKEPEAVEKKEPKPLKLKTPELPEGYKVEKQEGTQVGYRAVGDHRGKGFRQAKGWLLEHPDGHTTPFDTKQEAIDLARRMEEPPPVPLRPLVSETVGEVNPEQFIKVAADNVDSLRATDVYRVLSETPPEHRYNVKQYIIKNHDDNQRILDATMKAWGDLRAEAENQAGPIVDETTRAYNKSKNIDEAEKDFARALKVQNPNVEKMYEAYQKKHGVGSQLTKDEFIEAYKNYTKPRGTEEPIVVKTKPSGDVVIKVKPEPKGITLKEQKTYLLAEIDKAIEGASGKSPKKMTKSEYQDAKPKEVLARSKENENAFGYVTIDVPGDGTFKLFNTKESLSAFRKAANAIKLTEKPAGASTTEAGTTGRVTSPDVEYYNEYKPKRQKPPIAKDDNVYADGYFAANGEYLLKMPKPEALYREKQPPLADAFNSMGLAEAKPVDLFIFKKMVSDDAYVHAIGHEEYFDPKYIDAILTAYPNAKPFKAPDKKALIFKEGKEVVGMVMALNDKNPDITGYFADRIAELKNETDYSLSIEPEITGIENASEEVRAAIEKGLKIAKAKGVVINSVKVTDKDLYLDARSQRGTLAMKAAGYSEEVIDDCKAGRKVIRIRGTHDTSFTTGGRQGTDIELFNGHNAEVFFHELTHGFSKQGRLQGWYGTEEQRAVYMARILAAGKEKGIAEFDEDIEPPGKTSLKKEPTDYSIQEENASKYLSVIKMKPLSIGNAAISEAKALEIYNKLNNATNIKDGNKIEFVGSIFGKLARHKEHDQIFKTLPHLKEIVEGAEPAYFEEERDPEKHNNIIGYHNYVSKVDIGGSVYFARLTVQEVKKPDGHELHNLFLSDIEIYKAGIESNPSSVTAPYGAPTIRFLTSPDNKLIQWLKKVKADYDSISSEEDRTLYSTSIEEPPAKKKPTPLKLKQKPTSLLTRVMEWGADDWIRVQELTEKPGAIVTEATNPYNAEQKMRNKISTRKEDAQEFASKVDKDILATAKKNNLDEAKLLDDVNRYLTARHAPDYNKQHGENAAGMTDAEAADIITEIEALPEAKEIKRIAGDIQTFGKKTLDVLLEGGVIDQKLYDKLRTLYPEHVSLNRVMENDDIIDTMTGGRGFGVQGTGLKRAKGSELEVADILTNVIHNYGAAITRAEKNFVDNRTLEFVRENDYFDGLFEEVKLPMVPVGNVQHRAAVDPAFMKELADFARSLGAKFETTGLPGRVLGMYYPADKNITRKFGTPREVHAHETAHFFDDKYGLKQRFFKRGATKTVAEEMLKHMEASGESANRMKKTEERFADAFEWWLTHRDLAERDLPLFSKEMAKIIGEIPELKPILNIEPKPAFTVESMEKMMFSRQKFSTDPAILPIMEKGKQVYLKINEPHLAKALRGINREELGSLMSGVRAFTRFYASLATRWNPEFALPNKMRDMQEVLTYVASLKELSASQAAKIPIKDPQSILDITNWELGRDTEGAKLYQEMRMAGASQGSMGLSTKKDIELDVEKIRKINRSNPRKAAKMMLDLIDHWNRVFEDSTRLSVYKAYKDAGYSKERAATVALEASINFSKMGTSGPVINALWMFSNASIRGSVKMIRAMKNPKVLGAVVMIIGAAVYAVNEWNEKVDPEYYKKISKTDSLNGLNVLIPGSGKGEEGGVQYFNIPVSWSLKPIKVGIDEMYHLLSGHKTSAVDSLQSLFVSIFNAYNPVGGTDVVTAVIPTPLDVFVDVARNKKWTGAKIKPDWDKNAPESTRYFENLGKTLQGQVFIEGSKKLAGAGIEISPADVNYAFESLAGGAGRTISKTINTLFNFKDTSAARMPFVSRFYRDVPEEQLRDNSGEGAKIKSLLMEQSRDRFYQMKKAEELVAEWNKLPASEANRNLKELTKKKPFLAREIIQIKTEEKLGYTPTEKLITRLGITNGERAKYLWQEAGKEKTAAAKNQYIKNMMDKKIITDTVLDQIRYLEKHKGAK